MKIINKILLIILGLLFCYLSLDFIKNAKDNFFFLNYDWENVESKQIDSLELIDYKVNNLSVKSTTDFVFSNQSTYKIEDYNYFRAERIERKDDEIKFIGVHWINEYPRSIPKKFLLNEVNLSLIQKKGVKIAMIGDSQMVWREGKYTRKWIAEKLKLKFVGDQLDVFGFPYFYKKKITSEKLNSLRQQLKDIEILILFADWRDFNLNDLLSDSKDKEIIFINGFLNQEETELLDKFISKERLHIINLSNFKKESFFLKETGYLNYDGHYELAEEIITKLTNIGIEKN